MSEDRYRDGDSLETQLWLNTKHRLLVKGVYEGKKFQKEIYDIDGKEFWWSEGNGACDCNRGYLVGKDFKCNVYENKVKIDSITPIDKNSKVEPIILNESLEV